MISQEKSPLIFSRGVAAVLSYEGNLYGIPTQAEDLSKFEVAVSTKDESKDVVHGYLKNSKVGFIGGRVEGSETESEALEREILAELAEVTSLSTAEVRETVLPDLKWEEPKKIDNFKVFQARQPNKEAVATPRGAFEIYLTTIELSEESFEKLKQVLRKIDEDSIKQLRPFAASIVRNKL